MLSACRGPRRADRGLHRGGAAAGWGPAAGVGRAGARGDGLPKPAAASPEGFGSGPLAAPELCREAEPPAVDAAGTTTTLERLATGATNVRGVLAVVGAADRWCAGVVEDGATTTFSGGGEAELEPIEGTCELPVRRSSAVAPAPIRRGTSSVAARRAAAPTASHFPRSLADRASPPLSPRTGHPGPEPDIQETRSEGNPD
jgi:hypothetical protein